MLNDHANRQSCAADSSLNLTEAETNLLTNYRLLSPGIKALIYGYIDHLALYEACTGPEPSVPRGQHLAFILPISEMEPLLGTQPIAQDGHLLVLISVFFDRLVVYELTDAGANKVAEESDMMRVMELKEATLGAVERIPPAGMEALIEKYKGVINEISPFSIIPVV